VTPDNLNRELNGLFEAMEFFNKQQGLIITFNQEDTFEKEGRKIELVPAHKWLSEW